MEIKLQTFLEKDKDRVMTELQRDRTVPAAQSVLEKELDRLGFLFAESCPDDAAKKEASHSLSAVRNMVPVLSAVSETREWKRETSVENKKRIRPAAVLLLAAGIILTGIGAMPAVVNQTGVSGSFSEFLRWLPFPLLGCICLFFAGYFQGKPQSEKRRGESLSKIPDRKQEFLTDPDALWNSLHGVILLTDRYLEETEQLRELENELNIEALGGRLSPETAGLLSDLLETAYGKVSEDPSDEASRGMISEIRYFLHRNQIDVVDYSEKTAGWFERLPGKKAGTLRPALVSGQTLIKKGLASG